MVLVSFHKQMHTQPCGTEDSFHSDCGPTPSPVALNFTFSQKGGPYGIGFFS